MPAARSTLNAHNLEALGAATLAALLLELSEGNAAAKRRLRLALAAGQSAEEAGREVRKRLRAIDRSDTFLDAARRRSLLSELEGHLATIRGAIRSADPALALGLHWELLELSEGVLDRCDDSSGQVAGFFHTVLQSLAETITATAPQPEVVAEQLAEALQHCNGYGQLDDAVELLAGALGRAGLEALRRECRARGADEGSAVLLAVADALGDVESFVAAFDAEDLQWPPNAAAVASRLLQVGRAGEALAVVKAVKLDGREWMAGVLSDPQIAALEALGRAAEAQQLRRQRALEELNPRHLRDYLSRLPAFEDGEAEEEALDLVQADPDHGGALRFLLAWPVRRRAAALVLAHADTWDGEAYNLLGPAAEQLEADHPLAATVLLRSMVHFALTMGRSSRYRHAARHLRRCVELAPAITDWADQPPHTLYLDELRRRHGHKYGFWALADEQG